MNRTARTRTTLGILAGAALTATLAGTAAADPATTASDVAATCPAGVGSTLSGLIPCATGNNLIDSAVAIATLPEAGSAIVAMFLPGACTPGVDYIIPCSPTGSAAVVNGISHSISAVSG